MNSEQFYSLLSSLAYGGVLLLVFIVLSWLLSYLLNFIKEIVQFLVSKLIEKSRWAYQKASTVLSAWLSPFIAQFKSLLGQRSRHLIRSWLKEESLRGKLRSLNKAISTLETRANPAPVNLEESVSQLKAIDVPAKSRAIAKHLLRFFLYFVFVLAVVSINTFLMSEFWSSLAIGFSTYIPVLGLTYANVLALLFAVIEVALGIAHHHLEPHDDTVEQPRFYSTGRIFIWFAIIALALIEAAAFARMSAVLQFASKLGIPPDNALHGLFNYFLAPFGIGVTLTLFLTGYLLTETVEALIEERTNLRPLRRLRKQVKHLERLARRQEQAAPVAPSHVEDRASIVQSLRARMEEAIQSINSYTQRQHELLNQNIDISNAQMSFYVFRDLFLACSWGIMCFLSYHIALRALNNLGLGLIIAESIPIATFVAWMIAGAVGLFGYFLSRWITESHGAEHTPPGTFPAVNRALVILTIITLAGILIVVGVGLAIGGQAHWITWLVGLLVLMTLFVLGMFLKDYIDALVFFFRSFLAYTASLAFLLLGFVLTTLRIIIICIYAVYSLLIAPGLAVRKYILRSSEIPAPFPLLLAILVVINFSCVTPPQSGTRVFYLFDISGSYRIPEADRNTPLKASINFAKKIVDQLSVDKQIQGQFPQQHRIGFISKEITHSYGKDWFEIGKAPNPFDPGTSTENFKTELDSVLSLPIAGETDIYAGLYIAAEALKTAHVRNKLLIVFSDFDNTSQNPVPQEVSLQGVKVVMVYSETNKKDANKLIANRKKFEEVLKSAGCANVLSMHLIAAGQLDILALLKGPQ